MFKVSDMFPVSDVLSQIQGVEESLRKRRRIGAVGWLVFICGSTIQLLAEFNNLGIFSISDIWAQKPWLAAGILTSAFVVLASLLLAVWSTFWLSKSKRPFRYTCNIGKFKPLKEETEESRKAFAEKLEFLPLDLSRQLNDRVQRFGFLESDSAATANDEEGPHLEAHIHIHGHYVIRQSVDSGGDEIEVTPSVRIGPRGSPEVLAPTPPPTSLSGENSLNRKTYNELLEHIYHSVVSEVYRQLQEDVQRKIDLLPTARLKAIALLYEADDYARSNTLHSYDQATDLYYKAAQTIDPTLRVTPEGFFLRFLFRTGCYIAVIRRSVRNFEARYRPAAAETNLLRTRALIGYARMLCFRRLLAIVVGAGANEIYEAVRILENTYASLEKLSRDVAGSSDVKFECFTVWALSLEAIDDLRSARKKLLKARELDPIRAEQDAIYLFAQAYISDDQRTRLSSLRRAVELEPRFEVAQFVLAHEIELLWRSKESFEPTVAQSVIAEYKKVLKINPGNLGAWANSGYISWLLGKEHLAEAERYFIQGYRFKEIKQDIYVSELEYGLTRIYAELGRFDEAYSQYVAATSRMVAGGKFQRYYFEPMTPATLRRFQDYYVEFTRMARKARSEEDRWYFENLQERRRLRNSIHAFVLCDLGEAYTHAGYAHNLSVEERGPNILDRARTAMKSAIRHNCVYAFPHYQLGLLQTDYVEARKNLLQAVELEPMWADALMELVRIQAKAAPERDRELEQSAERKKEIGVKLTELDKLTREQKKSTQMLAQSDFSDNARSASSALRQQYNLKDDTDSPRLSRRQQQPKKTPTQPSNEDYRKRIKTLKNEIEALEDEIKLHNTNADDYRVTAQIYRKEARQLIRKLLPHEWLWNENEEFNWAALNNRQYVQDLRWERELTGIHVSALYHWALRFVYDDKRTRDALRLLDHIARHFSPANAVVLENILKLKLERNQSLDEKKTLVKKFCAKNYCVLGAVTDLAEIGFSIDEEINLLSSATRDYCVVRNPGLRDLLLNRLARALLQKAIDPDEKDPVDTLYAALEQARGSEINADIHLEIARRLLPTKDRSVLETAINHVSNHDRLAGYEDYKLNLSNLEPKRAELLRIEGSVELWGDRGKKFTAVAPLISVRLGTGLANLADLSESEDDRSREQILIDLEKSMYGELGIQFPAPVIGVDSKIDEPCRYFIDLEGMPLVTQKLNLNKRMVNGTAADLAGKNIDAEVAINPANGTECAFVTDEVYQSHKTVIDKLGYSWDPFSYIVLHLAAELRKQALSFLRLDRVADLLRYNGLGAELEELTRTNKLLKLTNVLRALVCEEIPILKLGLIVELFQSLFDKFDNLTELSEAIRSHHNFRRNIPFLNRPYYFFVPLGKKFEQTIQQGLANGDGRVLALSPEITQDLLQSVRDYVTSLDPESQNPVIMTRPELRLWVRRLVELEFPHFPVLSEKEVLPERLDSVRGKLELV